jgi:3-deoxy-7-phosphoheptulonate synthase
MKNIKLSSLEMKDKTIVSIGHVRVGEGFCVMAGPCTVESERQTIETAHAVKESGADILRGGAFKPRTSPYAFQGLGLKGLKILKKLKKKQACRL